MTDEDFKDKMLTLKQRPEQKQEIKDMVEYHLICIRNWRVGFPPPPPWKEWNKINAAV